MIGLQQKLFGRWRRSFLLAIVLVCIVSLQAMAVEDFCENAPANIVDSIVVTRAQKNPLITFSSSPSLGRNINGPSVIRVPAWIKKPLGNYYMYFAHHKGDSIRLAYSDSLDGPWSIYEEGTLQLDQAPGFLRHIASPDVHIDDDLQKIRMYFHGPMRNKKQRTGVAVSSNGLDFHVLAENLGVSYFRVFRYKEYYYAIDGIGILNRSKNPIEGWAQRQKKLIDKITIDDQHGRRTRVRIRHSAVLLKNDHLLLFYSMKEDAPERIYLVSVELTDDWEEWKASCPIEVLRPEMDYEGIHYPILPSHKGASINVHQLRDPCIFQENEATYLFYSTSGETGIAMAELEFIFRDNP